MKQTLSASIRINLRLNSRPQSGELMFQLGASKREKSVFVCVSLWLKGK